jgi:hypothetical protein
MVKKMQKKNGNRQDGEKTLLPSGMRAGDMVKGRYFMGTLMPYRGEHGIFHADTFSIRVIEQGKGGKRFRVLPQQIRFSTATDSHVIWTYDKEGLASKPLADYYMERVPNSRIDDVLPAPANRFFDEVKASFGVTITEKEMREFMSKGKTENAVADYWNSIEAKSESAGISDVRKRVISAVTGVPFTGEEKRAGGKAAKTARMMTFLKS